MQVLNEYRHLIGKEEKQAFLKSFKTAIDKVDKNKFGFIGIIGSINEETSHDIDVLIFPNFNTKIGEAIIEYSRLYDETEKQLKKIHKRYYLAITQKFAMQELVNHLSSHEEGSVGMIPVHSMFFANYRDFVGFSPKKFLKNVNKKLISLHGDLNKMKKLPELSQEKLEPYFFVLDFEMNARIKTFPRHLIRASAESLFEYLNKKYKIKINPKIPHNIKEIEKKFEKLMHLLDEKTYSN